MADDFSVRWDGVGDFFDWLGRAANAADDATRELVDFGSTLLTATAQQNFSGSHAPGEPHTGGSFPNIVSGDLRRSIVADPITRYGDADYGTIVAPRMIYGRRVELGFQGSQGYPFFGPAVTTVTPQYERAAAEIWQRHMSGV